MLLLFLCLWPFIAFADIIIMNSQYRHTGNVQSRSVTNDMCQCLNDHCYSMLSYYDDSIINLPLPIHDVVKSQSGIVLASNWSTLFKRGPQVSLAAAEVLPDNVQWYTGTDAAGNAVGLNCHEWTMESKHALGRVGNSHATNYRWIDDEDVVCSSTLYLVCACLSL